MLARLFWTAVGGLAWVYAGYPAVAALLARVRPIRVVAAHPIPPVTIAIAVHDEADAIADRIADALAQDGPGSPIVEVLVGSDGSADETDEIVRALAGRDPRVRLLSLPRAGQTATQHALFRAARGDVVVLTDAETRFEPGCIARLIAPLRDPRIACTTGRLEWREQDATATSANEGAYWRYERLVRRLESQAGLLTAVTGALLAIRRSCYRPVPPSASMDHLLPLYVREQGSRVLYVPEAAATDRPISGLQEQFRSRSRTATRGIAANLSMVARLSPRRHPDAALAIWSHKLLRWATPWLGLVALASGSALAARGARTYALVPIGSAAVVAGGLAAHIQARSGRRPVRVLAFARSFLVVNAAFATAWLNVLRGRRIEHWHRSDWLAARRAPVAIPIASAAADAPAVDDEVTAVGTAASTQPGPDDHP